MSTPYPLLFTPIRLGKIELHNRVIMGAMQTLLEETEDGWERLQAFYLERARNGVGLIITGGVGPNQHAPTVEGGVVLNQNRQLREHSDLVSAVHGAGARICMQILHAGRYALGKNTVAPSAITAPNHSLQPRALTGAEIKQTILDFVRCAMLAQKAGYDGVEIVGSEGYLLNSFLAPRTNQRDDNWGGTFEQRIRVVVAVIKFIRRVVGPDFLIIYRLSMLDLVEDGSNLDETLRLAQAVVGAGADVINTSVGWQESRIPTITGMVPRGAFAWITAKLRERVKVPLMASHRINTPEAAEEILAAGMADLVSMARPFLADPEFLPKAQQGKSRAINTCNSCNQACLDQVYDLNGVTCMVNPRACRETLLRFDPVTKRKYVAVVGAGPAGLAFAVHAAQRGHKVTLFEASDRIGGQFNLAQQIPGKQEFHETLRYFKFQLNALDVHVHLRRQVNAKDLDLGFDHVVVATGVKPRLPAIRGIDNPMVLTYRDVLLGQPVGERVVIIGAGGIGFDLALLLTQNLDDDCSDDIDRFVQHWGIDTRLQARGGLLPRPSRPSSPRKVSLLQRRLTKPGSTLGKTSGWITTEELLRRGVALHSAVEYLRIDDIGLHARIHGMPRLFPADNILVCAGQEPCNDLAQELKQLKIPVSLIGGALSTHNLDAKRAIAEAARLAATL